jgi:addiction module HigA family antidote
MVKKLPPMHPGEVLREEFLVPLGLSAGALPKACGVPRTRIERIANEETAITADTALRLGKALGTSAELWLNLQTDFDMRTAKGRIGKELEKINPVKGRKAAYRSPLSLHRHSGAMRSIEPGISRFRAQP